MTRKKINLFLVFICLFFIRFNPVKADEPSTLIVDFSTIEDAYSNYSITDVDTGTVYNNFEIFNWIIENYSNNYKFYLQIPNSPTNNELNFTLVVCDNSTFNFFLTSSSTDTIVLRLNPSSSWYVARFSSYSGGTLYDKTQTDIDSGFSMSVLKSSLDNLFTNWSASNKTLTDFWFYRSSDFTMNSPFPYFSNINSYFDGYDKNNQLVINVFHSSARQIIIQKGDDMSPFFFISGSKITDDNAPIPDISFSDVITDDNNIVTSVTATINFSDFKGSYRNKYSFNNIETTIEEQTSFSINSNGLLSARSCSKTNNICYNKKSYNIDFIGKDKRFFDDFMQDVYFENLVGEEPVLTSSSGVHDYLNWYVYHFKKTYPIILQLKDLITMFDTRTSSGIHDNQPLPAFNINLGFLGINQNYNIFDLSILLPYKDRIYNLIKYICAIYTFITVINLVKEMTDNS